MDDVLVLFKTTYTKNQYGVDVATHERKEVFCKCESVSRSEFFNAGRNGLNPQFVFTMFAADYDNETVCEYHGETYGIYRTYLTDDDYIELYVERNGGTNGAESNA